MELEVAGLGLGLGLTWIFDLEIEGDPLVLLESSERKRTLLDVCFITSFSSSLSKKGVGGENCDLGFDEGFVYGGYLRTTALCRRPPVNFPKFNSTSLDGLNDSLLSSNLSYDFSSDSRFFFSSFSRS
ncbi:hypothetical protein LXL04_018616 [Taraxacum kok-saghyz]